jgi:hypothetical protein
MFRFTEYHMSALNHSRNVVHFIDSQIFEISRDFVSSVLQFDHFIDEIENFLIARTLDVQHDVSVRQRFVFVISNVWVTNDENAVNLINQLFFEEREECLIEEFLSNSNVISSSVISLILSNRFESNFLLYQFFRVERIMFVSNSTCYWFMKTNVIIHDSDRIWFVLKIDSWIQCLFRSLQSFFSYKHDRDWH